jgi:eukaryotic-like serine/threonine-protein kinase
MAVDADVAQLLREERLTEAAALLTERGNHAEASRVLERACAFADAARSAMRADDSIRALCLAFLARDEALQEALLAEIDDVALARRAAETLETQRAYLLSAKLFALVGSHDRAAQNFERAGEPMLAAEAFERAGDPRAAARVLEAAKNAGADPSEVGYALGRLLLLHGRHEQAARALQAVHPDSPLAVPARTLLTQALQTIGILPVTHAGSDAQASTPKAGRDVDMWFARYRVERIVHKSLSAEIARAHDQVLAQFVAIKRFAASTRVSRDAYARFEREARVMASLKHPNILPLLAYHPEGPALVLPWMSGGSLADKRALSPKRAVEIACSVLLALAEAHAHGIIHRDLKPSNVLFDEADNPKIADFGVAHLGENAQTATAGFIGTFRYMSPEQKRGAPAWPASDVYAVGAMLMEVLEATQLPAAQVLKWIEPMLAEEPANRPSAKDAAQALSISLRNDAWDDEVIVRPAARASVRAVLRTNTERAFEAVELSQDPRALERARAFARCNHPMVQTVLGLVHGTLRLAPLLGIERAHTSETQFEADLQEALTELNELGCKYGPVTPGDIWDHPIRGSQLRFK